MIQQLIDLIKQNMQTNQFLTGGLVLGALTSIFYSLKSVPGMIWFRIKRKIFYEVTIEQNDDLYPWVQNYLHHFYSSELRSVRASFWRVVDHIYGLPEHNSNEKKTRMEYNKISYNHYGDEFNIWFSGRLVSVASQKEKFEHAQNIASLFFEKYYIRGFFAKTAITKFLDAVVDFNLKQEKDKVVIRVQYNKYHEWHQQFGVRLRNLNSVFIDVEQKNRLIADITQFIGSKDFYIDKNIPYRRGYLFYGPPGTGKSSLVSAIANHFKRDLYVMNLKAVDSDSALNSIMADIRPKSILLIEDIDRYFNEEAVNEANTKISYSSFINAISGVMPKEDVMLFITTNNKDRLDSALLRSGRLDGHYEIGYPTDKEVSEYLTWFYNKPIQVRNMSDVSMADVENACIRNKTNHESALIELHDLSGGLHQNKAALKFG